MIWKYIYVHVTLTNPFGLTIAKSVNVKFCFFIVNLGLQDLAPPGSATVINCYAVTTCSAAE